jgi:hypothetical protein
VAERPLIFKLRFETTWIETFQGNVSVLLLGHLVLLTSHHVFYLLGERKSSVYVPPLPSTLRELGERVPSPAASYNGRTSQYMN